MKKFMMLAAIVALVAAVVAIPAMARSGADGGGLVDFADCFPFCNDEEEIGQAFEEAAPFAAQDSDRDRSDRFDDSDRSDRFDDSDGFDDDAGVSLDFGDQAAQSGDVSQSFSVGNAGNNSNQCVGFQGFANTGNLQNQQGVLQYGSDGDVAFDGGGFVFAPSSGVSCEQAVQQSAAASSR